MPSLSGCRHSSALPRRPDARNSDPLSHSPYDLQAATRSRYEVAGGPQQRARFERWLCFGEATRLEALRHANLLCREFALGEWARRRVAVGAGASALHSGRH